MKLKIKNNLSIIKKLFIITTIVFAVFITSTLIIQSLFFSKFYIYKKKNDLKHEMEKFKVEYNKVSNSEKYGEIIDEYESNLNLKIIVLDSSNRINLVNNASKNRNDIYRVRELTDFIRTWKDSGIGISEFIQKNESIIVMTQTREINARNLISLTPNKEKGEIIFAISSLQPVNEAVSVIKQLYLYFCIGAVFFIILLSFVYSNMIAKPLLKINKTASKMAQLDFTEKCEVNSEDEIGSLATSLNFLSENLDYALTSLKEANLKLEKDIEKERNLERMRKEFIAAVSHELKTPITLIDGYAVGLKDNIFEEEDKDYYLDIIIDESKKMGSLVSEMLDLSYLESGTFKLSKEEFNFTELINFTLKKYGAIISDKKINVDVNLLEEFSVYADFDRMEQVLTNFITNAIRHTEDNGTIIINMIDKKEYVSVEVENTGSKIPDEDIHKIWDKFYKIDKSRNRKLGGTGIGLSIVKNILMLHGYSFGAENTESGVKFYFNIQKLT